MRWNFASVDDRFWSKVDKSGKCWEWTASLRSTGYGQFMMPNHKPEKAHRMAWKLTYGDISSGLWVLHKCDNRKCVRPDHLFLGNCKDNMQDCSRKGRVKIPKFTRDSHPNAKLTSEEFALLKEEYVSSGISLQALARKHGVSRSTVHRAVHA